MPPADRWRRVGELFDAAASREGEERRRFLDAACAGDAALRTEVAGLLDAERRSGGDAFISGMVASAADALVAERAASWVGREVGRYRLLGELAHGGMGTVYLAERADAAYAARVAIKFVRGAVAGSELVRRFVAERQMLADLVHPNIARLLDGGASDDGTPYLVMEYIDGVSIDVYCDQHDLGVRERLALFSQVCDAVQHAHGRLIVHRDIKPSNILVTAEGTPKLLDFGVAKLLDPTQSEGTLDTGVGPRLLTPAYASPEQVRGEPITTATDVYSLGVLLYRLLAGALPYGAGTLRDHALAEAIVGTEPEPPSRAAARAGGAQRAARAGGKAARVERDVDAIVLTALAKDPSRRYVSVEQLAADIRRYLEGLPIDARPATRRYRAGKFVARHRRGVLAAAGVAVFVVGLTATYLLRLTRERDFAERERRKSAEVSAFLERLFAVADPNESRGRTVTAREVVDSAAARLPRELRNEPQVRAAMLYTLGGVYNNLGFGQEARPLLERGLALRREDPGPGSPTVGDFLGRLGVVALDLSRFDSAAVLLREAIQRRETEYVTKDSATASRIDLAMAHRRAGQLAAADSALERALADARLTPNDSLLPVALSARAALMLSEGRAAAAEPVAREAWQRYRDLFGDDSPLATNALSTLGQALYQQSRYAEAEPIMWRVLAIERRVNGETHPAVGKDWNNLAALFQANGRPDSAVVAERRALAIYKGAYGDRHQRVTLAMSNLASMLLAAGNPREAEQLDREVLKIERATLPPGHIDIAVVHNNLAHVLEEQHRYRDAEAEYRAALGEIGRGMGVRSPNGSIFLANLGGVLQEEGRLAEAEASLRQALAIQREILPARHAATATTLSALGALLVVRGRAAAAQPLLTEALAMRTALLPADHWAIQVTRSALGECLAALNNKPAEAETLLTTSAEALTKRLGSGDARVRTARDRVARFYAARGDTARAGAFRAGRP